MVVIVCSLTGCALPVSTLPIWMVLVGLRMVWWMLSQYFVGNLSFFSSGMTSGPSATTACIWKLQWHAEYPACGRVCHAITGSFFRASNVRISHICSNYHCLIHEAAHQARHERAAHLCCGAARSAPLHATISLENSLIYKSLSQDIVALRPWQAV